MHRDNKPQAHVIDIIKPHPGSKQVYQKIIAARPFAHRFIFDEEASRYAGQFIRDCDDLLLANRQFALPPYDVTYLEYRSEVLVKTIGRGTTNDPQYGMNDDTCDVAVGYLIDHGTVYSVVKNKGGLTSMGHYTYRLNTPTGSGPILASGPINPNDPFDIWPRAILLLGTTTFQLPDDDDATLLDIVRNTHITFNTPVEDLRKDFPREMLIRWSAGDIRTLWALLLLLNQKRYVTTTVVPWRHGIVNGKRHVFAKHNIVKLHLRPQEATREIFERTLKVKRRRHEVAAHFAHYHLHEGCIHDWPLLPEVTDDGTPRWACNKCGGLRVRRKAHWRGKGGEGIVNKEYQVTE
jgi:hypothetical protein